MADPYTDPRGCGAPLFGTFKCGEWAGKALPLCAACRATDKGPQWAFAGPRASGVLGAISNDRGSGWRTVLRPDQLPYNLATIRSIRSGTMRLSACSRAHFSVRSRNRFGSRPG